MFRAAIQLLKSSGRQVTISPHQAHGDVWFGQTNESLGRQNVQGIPVVLLS